MFFLYNIYMKEKDFMDYWRKHIHINSILRLSDKNNKRILVKILYKGEINRNFGPDIQNAKIKINNICYSGDIEFHRYSIDWFRHSHHLDDKYNNVVLHIVYQNNSKIRIINLKNRRIKTFILKDVFIRNNNQTGQDHRIKNKLPCYYMIKRKMNNIQTLIKIFLDMGMNNIKRKITDILKFYFYFKNIYLDPGLYDQILFVSIFKGLGYYHNRYNFQNKIMHVNHNRTLAFLKEYLMQCDFKCYGRPNNFPDKRIFQFVNFIKNCNYNIFQKIYECFLESGQFEEFIKKITYLFNKNLAMNKVSYIRVKTITYNLIMPVLYIFFRFNNQEEGLQKLMNFILKAEKFEDNKILYVLNHTLKFDLKQKTHKEIITQGYYYLYHSFCKTKKCEKCYLYKKLS